MSIFDNYIFPSEEELEKWEWETSLRKDENGFYRHFISVIVAGIDKKAIKRIKERLYFRANHAEEEISSFEDIQEKDHPQNNSTELVFGVNLSNCFYDIPYNFLCSAASTFFVKERLFSNNIKIMFDGIDILKENYMPCKCGIEKQKISLYGFDVMLSKDNGYLLCEDKNFDGFDFILNPSCNTKNIIDQLISRIRTKICFPKLIEDCRCEKIENKIKEQDCWIVGKDNIDIVTLLKDNDYTIDEMNIFSFEFELMDLFKNKYRMDCFFYPFYKDIIISNQKKRSKAIYLQFGIVHI